MNHKSAIFSMFVLLAVSTVLFAAETKVYTDIGPLGNKTIIAKLKFIAENDGKGVTKVYTDIGPLGNKTIIAKPKFIAENDGKGVTKVYTDIGPLGNKTITAKPKLILESKSSLESSTLLVLMIIMRYF